MTRRAAVIVALAVLGACGGGGGHAVTTPTSTPPPAARVDRNSNGTIAGPVNGARNAVDNLNQRQRQDDQSGG